MRVSKQRRYDEAFKRDALTVLERSDRTLYQVARDLGIDCSTLRYWYNSDVAKKKGQKSGSGAKPAAPANRAETLEEENLRLKQELAEALKKNAELEIDRAILKKAAAFFAKESE